MFKFIQESIIEHSQNSYSDRRMGQALSKLSTTTSKKLVTAIIVDLLLRNN